MSDFSSEWWMGLGGPEIEANVTTSALYRMKKTP